MKYINSLRKFLLLAILGSGIGLFAFSSSSFLQKEVEARSMYGSGYSHITAANVTDTGFGNVVTISLPQVNDYDTNTAAVFFVHYRSTDQSVTSIDVDLTGATPARSGGVIRESEYTTEAWVVTGLTQGFPSANVYWSGGVADVVVEVYYFTGVSQTSPVVEVITNQAPTNTQQPILNFTQSNLNHIYVGAITSYTDQNTISATTMFDESNTAFTTNTNAASGHLYVAALNTVSLEWSQTSNWQWSGIGLALRDIEDQPLGPQITYADYGVQTFNGPASTMTFYGPNVTSPSDQAYVIFVHYRSNYDYANQIQINSNANIAQKAGGPYRQNEYSTEAWVATGLPSGSPEIFVNWSYDVDDAVVEVYLFSGVNQLTPYDQFVFNNADSYVVQPNLPFIASTTSDLFIGAVTTYYEGGWNTISPNMMMDGERTAFTTNVLAASGYVIANPSTQITLEWWQSTNWHWSGVGVSLKAGGGEVVPSQPETPSISFTVAPTEGSTVGEVVRFAGTITTNTSPIDTNSSITYGAQDWEYALGPGDYTVISPNEWAFDFEVRLPLGAQYVGFWGQSSDVDSRGLMSAFNLNVVETERADCVLTNLGSQISDTTPTYTAVCSSEDGISQASFKIYHEVNGTIVNWTNITSPSVGAWGGLEVQLAFTSPVSLGEGAHLVFLDAKNNHGMWISTDLDEGVLPVDRIVVEAVDNRAPRLHVNAIEPNPTSDIQPYLTGICTDDYETETNSFINAIEYRIDSGTWTNIYSYAVGTASSSKIFETQLPQLAVNSQYTIDVRCSDTAGNITPISSQTLDVIAQQTENPQKIVVAENFITQDRKIPFYTDAIWGNSYLRLKEQLTPSFTGIDSANYMTRYGSTHNISTYVIKEGTDNLVWYVKENQVVRYNTQTLESYTYTNTFFGVSGFTDVAQIEDASGNKLAWITHYDGLILLNVTNNTFIHYFHTDLINGFTAPNRVVADTRDGRIGAYIRSATPNTVTNSNIVYIDTNGTFGTAADDTVVWFSTPAAFNYSNIYSVTLDQVNDVLYMGKPGVGLVKVSDNGTPTTTNDYTGPITYATSSQVTDIALDPTSDSVFFIKSALNDMGLYVITDISSDPWNFSGQTVTQLANSSDFEYQHLYYLHFVEGPEYIGNQLFIGTDQGKVFYYNTNNTYTSTNDDTLLTLDLSQGLYPLSIGQLVVTDYNTLYVSYDRLGVYKVDLGRGWDTQNAAVVLAPLPAHRLNINNITLESLNITTRVDSDGVVDPTSQASAMPYYSLDDGMTWTQLQVGETQNFNSQDYRLRFKIDLAQNPGTTPIVDQFNVAFGSYQETSVTDHYGIEVEAGDKWINELFNVTIEAQDQINYLMPDYAGSVTLTLYNANTNQVVSFSPSTANLLNGTATIASQISTAGDYYITATGAGYSGQSANFTISQPINNDPVPTMSFTSNTYTINTGGSATLSWTTQDFSSVSLSGVGSVAAIGTLSVSPSSTTTYVLSGLSSYGTVTSSLKITVNTPSSSDDDEEEEDGDDSESDSTTSTDSTTAQDTTAQTGSESDGSETDESSSDSIVDEESGVDLNFSSSHQDTTVKAGQKIRFEWNVTGNPDSVYLDYWGKEVSPTGHFELIAEKDLEITLTVIKDGKEYKETIKIQVESASWFEKLITNPIALLIGGLGLASGFFFILFKKRSSKKRKQSIPKL